MWSINGGFEDTCSNVDLIFADGQVCVRGETEAYSIPSSGPSVLMDSDL